MVVLKLVVVLELAVLKLAVLKWVLIVELLVHVRIEPLTFMGSKWVPPRLVSEPPSTELVPHYSLGSAPVRHQSLVCVAVQHLLEMSLRNARENVWRRRLGRKNLKLAILLARHNVHRIRIVFQVPFNAGDENRVFVGGVHEVVVVVIADGVLLKQIVLQGVLPGGRNPRTVESRKGAVVHSIAQIEPSKGVHEPSPLDVGLLVT